MSTGSAPTPAPPPPHPAPRPARPAPASNARVHCPVQGCPCSIPDRNTGWASVQSMLGHINAHLAGTQEGQVPEEWMSQHNKMRCTVCGLCVATSRRTHNTCRAKVRQSTTTGNNNANTIQSSAARVAAPQSSDLPILAEIHRRRVPTVKHVPVKARAAWARCLIRCLAAAVFFNTPAAWAELEMLPKCVLCPPPRTGKKHADATTVFTNDRLSRWSAGERASLWADIPAATGARSRRRVDTLESRLTRSEALAREGFDRKAC